MKERCCARCFILLLPLLLFLISCACAAGITCEINPAGSSWIPGESALFEGCISADGTVSSDGATMKLSIRTDPVLSDPGTIVFSEVNGKKLSIRNQKDEYTVSLPAGSEIRFSGSWLHSGAGAGEIRIPHRRVQVRRAAARRIRHRS